MLRSARSQIKCAFGYFKARWRILNRATNNYMKLVPDVIFTQFVVHNFCEKQKVSVDPLAVENFIIKERRNGNKLTN